MKIRKMIDETNKVIKIKSNKKTNFELFKIWYIIDLVRKNPKLWNLTFEFIFSKASSVHWSPKIFRINDIFVYRLRNDLYKSHFKSLKVKLSKLNYGWSSLKFNNRTIKIESKETHNKPNSKIKNKPNERKYKLSILLLRNW